MKGRRTLTLGVLAGLAASLATDAARAESSPPVQDVHRAPQPDASYGFGRVIPYPTLSWALLQLLPSPEVALGRQRHFDASGAADNGPRAAFGLRWQLTPLLWSFGVHRSQPRFRAFIVDPLARVSGSIELSTTFEYIGGDIDRVLVRPGVRTYLPILSKGEALSVSLGTSLYSFDDGLRVAYDVGAYTFSGFLGFQLTVAPTHAPLAGIATIRLRYF